MMRYNSNETYIPGQQKKNKVRPTKPLKYNHNVTNSEKPPEYSKGYKKQLKSGFLLIFILVFGLGFGTAITNIHGAIIARGVFVVEGKVKSVQHLSGGIVEKIYISNGDLVEAGDILISLNTTIVDASLSNLSYQEYVVHARQARLEAEYSGKTAIAWPTQILDHQSDPDVRVIIRNEEELLRTRRQLFSGRIKETKSAIKQNLADIHAAKAMLQAQNFQLESLQEEFQRLEFLYRSNAVPFQRVSSLERDIWKVKSEVSRINASLEQYFEQKNENEALEKRLKNNLQEEILVELSEQQGRLSGIKERLVNATDMGKRAEIRAPVSGVVHDLKFTSTNGIIPGGAEILQIVPTFGKFVLEARVEPKDIEQIQVNQPAFVTLSAFHPSKVPQLNGQVVNISADLLSDQSSGQDYYNVVISFASEELARLNEAKIISGMPADSFIQTRETTVLNYLLKPIKDALSRTFREE